MAGVRSLRIHADAHGRVGVEMELTRDESDLSADLLPQEFADCLWRWLISRSDSHDRVVRRIVEGVGVPS